MNKLEIWGRAQIEAARRCKSDWGDSLGKGEGVKIPLVATSRVPNAVTLAYTARAVLILGGWTCLTLPYLTFGVGRLLHLPSAEAVSVRANAQPRCNQKVAVIGCEAETSAVKPNKSPVVGLWLFLLGGLRLVSSSPSD